MRTIGCVARARGMARRRVAGAQRGQAVGVLRVVVDGAGIQVHQQVGEAGPVVVVVVDDQGDARVGGDVGQPLERARAARAWACRRRRSRGARRGARSRAARRAARRRRRRWRDGRPGGASRKARASSLSSHAAQFGSSGGSSPRKTACASARSGDGIAIVARREVERLQARHAGGARQAAGLAGGEVVALAWPGRGRRRGTATRRRTRRRRAPAR